MLWILFIQSSYVSAQSGSISEPSRGNGSPNGIVALDFSKYPAVYAVAPSNPEFNNRYDLSKVPLIPSSSPPENILVPSCPQTSGSCSWACDSCIRTSDIIQCKSNQDFGLSFDDGPSDSTPALLTYLQQRSLKASFFVTGSQVLLFPNILKQEFDQGHQIVIHTWSHRALTSLSNQQILAELEWTAVIIQDITGLRPSYFRPPFGDLDDRVRSIGALLGLKPVLWNYDTSDWKLFGRLSSPSNSTNVTVPTADSDIAGNAAVMASRWRNRDAGIISLQHDLYPATAAQGPFLIDAVRASGMNIKTVAECLGDSNPYTRPTELKPIDLDLGTSVTAKIPDDSTPPDKSGEPIQSKFSTGIFLISLLF